MFDMLQISILIKLNTFEVLFGTYVEIDLFHTNFL
jgi:hypothetical protein